MWSHLGVCRGADLVSRRHRSLEHLRKPPTFVRAVPTTGRVARISPLRLECAISKTSAAFCVREVGLLAALHWQQRSATWHQSTGTVRSGSSRSPSTCCRALRELRSEHCADDSLQTRVLLTARSRVWFRDQTLTPLVSVHRKSLPLSDGLRGISRRLQDS